MPANRNAVARYQIIDRLIGSKTYPNPAALQEAIMDEAGIKVSYRTILKDIEALSDSTELNYLAPIEYDRREKGYYYTQPFSLTDPQFSETERSYLTIMGDLLSRFSDLPIVKDMQAKLNSLVKGPENDPSQPKQNIIYFETAPLYDGTKNVAPLIKYIQNKTVIKIKHGRFQEEATREFVLHPYFLREYRNRWYLVAHGDGTTHQYPSIYGLERIKEIKPAQGVSFKPYEGDAESFFDNIMGITRMDAPVQTIKIAFDKEQARYQDSKPMHHSQKLLDKDERGWYIYQYQLIPNYEFYSAIVSMGNKCQVLQPEDVRTEVMKRLQDTLALYHD